MVRGMDAVQSLVEYEESMDDSGVFSEHCVPIG